MRRPLWLAAAVLLGTPWFVFPAYGYGVNNPSGDIQPLGGSGGGTTGASAGPAGAATGNVDWHGYTQTDSTQGGVQYLKPNWLPQSSATAPAFSFASDPNTGLYDASVGTLGMSTQGLNRCSLSSGGMVCTVPFATTQNLLYGPSTAAVPALSPSADSATGIFAPGAGQWGLATAGAQRLVVSASGLSASVPLVTSQAFLGPVASPAAVTYGFTADPNTGLYDAAVGTLGVASGGQSRLTIGPTIAATVPVYVPQGSAAAPGVAFAADPNTGLFDSAVGTLGLAASGQTRLTIGPAIAASVPLVLPAGSAGSPAYGFAGDTTTGPFDAAVGTWGLATSGSQRLAVSASGLAAQVPISTTAIFAAPAGSAAAASYGFAADPNTGLYDAAVGTLGLAAGGQPRLTVGNTIAPKVPVAALAGSAAAPSYSFAGDATSGLYDAAVGTVGVAAGGAQALSIGPTALSAPGSIAAGTTFSGPAGSATAPSFSFAGDANTGIYDAATGTLGLAAGGAARLTVAAAGVTSAVPVVAPAGNAAAPTYAFTGDTTTGAYDAAAGTWALATSGAQRLAVNSSALTCQVPAVVPAGSATAPSVSFSGDTTSGLYDVSAGTVGITTAGAQRLTVNSSALTSQVPAVVPAGTVGAPTLAFAGDTTTGIYDAAAGSIGFASAGHQAGLLRWYSNGLGNPNDTALQLGDLATNGAANIISNPYGNGTQGVAIRNQANNGYALLLASSLTAQGGSIATINPVANSSVVGFEDGGSGNYMAGMMYVGNGVVRLAPNNLVSPNTVGLMYGGKPSQAKTGAYTAVLNDAGSTIEVGATSTQTLPLSTNVGVGYVITYVAKGAYAITVAPNSADTLNVYGLTKAAGASVASTAASGSTITLQLTSANTWSCIAIIGSWS